MIASFSALTKQVQANAKPIRAAVVWPDQIAVDSAMEASREHIIFPVFVGKTDEITALLGEEYDSQSFAIVEASTPEEAATLAVSLAASGEVAILIKGHLDTRVLLKAVVSPESGLRMGKLMSHVAFVELPNRDKLLAVTDGGMVEQPNLGQKADILQNALTLLRQLGYEKPSIAILAAVEKVNPKSLVTVEAAELAQRANAGEFGACVAAGPISFDLAFSKEAAVLKEYAGLVQGDADMMLASDMTAGNILTKGMVLASGGKMAGLIVGAKVPIVVNSRSASADEKFNAIALAALCGGKK